MLFRDHDDVRHCSGSRVVEREDSFVLEDPLDHELAGQDFFAVPVGKSHARSSHVVELRRGPSGMDVIEQVAPAVADVPDRALCVASRGDGRCCSPERRSALTSGLYQ